MKKNHIFLSTRDVLWPYSMPKMRYRSGVRPGTRWRSSRRSPHSLVGWGGGYLLTTPHATPRFSRLLKWCVYNLEVTANIQQYAMTTEPMSANGLVVDYIPVAKYRIVRHSLSLAEIGCRKWVLTFVNRYSTRDNRYSNAGRSILMKLRNEASSVFSKSLKRLL